MSKYKQYLKENNLSYCTLYPNVSDIFPLELKVNSFVACCNLGKLLEIDHIHIQEQHWKGISASFKASDLCFCFQESILLIPSWDGVSNSHQKLNLS